MSISPLTLGDDVQKKPKNKTSHIEHKPVKFLAYSVYSHLWSSVSAHFVEEPQIAVLTH